MKTVLVLVKMLTALAWRLRRQQGRHDMLKVYETPMTEELPKVNLTRF
jgi:hypothetical protein